MIPDIEVINFQLLKASSNMPVTTVCKAFGIARSVFYYRKHRYERYGLLRSISKRPKHTRAIGKEIIAKIEEMRKTNGWKASRIARELLKQGVRLSEKTVRKYIPKKIEIKPVKKFKKEYEKLEQLQLDVKGRIYIGKNKLYPIGVIDRGTRVALSELKHSFKADSVIALCKQFIGSYGKPKAIKTDNHSVFRSKRFNAWLERNGIAHKYIKKKSPWQNGYIESFFKTMEIEFLRENFFTSINEAYRKMDEFVKDYNNTRYHTAIGCTPIERFNSLNNDNSMISLSKMSVP